MLTPDELEEYSWDMLGGAQAVLSFEMLRTILRYYALSCTLSPSDRRRLMELSTSQRREIDAILAAYNPVVGQQAVELTYDLLETSNARDADRLADHYHRPARDLSDESRQAAVGVAMIVERDNVSMGDNANRLWYEVSAWTTTEYATGTKSLDEIIAQGVEELLAHGLDSVQYVDSDGNLTVRNSVDVAIRRHAMTQANQAAARMTLEHMEEFGHDLVQTTAHMGARPTHEVWQGRAFSLSGERTIEGVTYPDFYAETGYGTVQGLCGANCRHQFYPHFPGDPLPPRPDTEENNRQYKESQKQRRLEREIRKAKKEAAGYELAADEATDPTVAEALRKKAEEARMRVGSLQAQMREHIAENDDFLVRQPKREKDYLGTAKTKAARRVLDSQTEPVPHKSYEAHRLTLRNEGFTGTRVGTVEEARVFDAEGNPLGKVFSGKENGVRFRLPPGYESWENLYVSHTHPSGGTLSAVWNDEEEGLTGDIFFLTDSNALGIDAVTDDYVYTLSRTRDADPKRFQKAAFDANEKIQNDVFDEFSKRCIAEKGHPPYHEDFVESYDARFTEASRRLDKWYNNNASEYGYSYTKKAR